MEEIILSFHSIFTSELIRVIVNISDTRSTMFAKKIEERFEDTFIIHRIRFRL